MADVTAAVRERKRTTPRPSADGGGADWHRVALRGPHALRRALRAALAEPAQAATTDVLEVRRRAQAADALAVSARATRLPELRLQAGIVDRGAPGEAQKAEWQAGLGVSYPLITGGARAGQIDRTAADARAASEQLRPPGLAPPTPGDRAVPSLIQSHPRVPARKSPVEASHARPPREGTSP